MTKECPALIHPKAQVVAAQAQAGMGAIVQAMAAQAVAQVQVVEMEIEAVEVEVVTGAVEAVMEAMEAEMEAGVEVEEMTEDSMTRLKKTNCLAISYPRLPSRMRRGVFRPLTCEPKLSQR
jgi:hypothetical protein